MAGVRPEAPVGRNHHNNLEKFSIFPLVVLVFVSSAAADAANSCGRFSLLAS